MDQKESKQGKGFTEILRLCANISRPDVDEIREKHGGDIEIKQLCDYINQIERVIALIIRRIAR